MDGHYEVRADHMGVPGVLAVVWADNGGPPVVLFTIGASGLPALVAVLARYVAGNPAPGERS